jgi:hypothetical protein
MYNNILNGTILWPDKKENGFSISKDAQDIISKLLIKNKKKRLGAINDADEIL